MGPSELNLDTETAAHPHMLKIRFLSGNYSTQVDSPSSWDQFTSLNMFQHQWGNGATAVDLLMIDITSKKCLVDGLYSHPVRNSDNSG